MKYKISKEDKKLFRDSINNIKSIPIAEDVLEEIIDIHGYTTDKAKIIIDNFILNNLNKSKLIIITGIGNNSEEKNILHNFVLYLLSQRNDIKSYNTNSLNNGEIIVFI